MTGRVFSHESPQYSRIWEGMSVGRWNGAYYYSREIVRNIIPRVDTDRNWVTLNVEGCCWAHSIVFVHNNVRPDIYEWLRRFDDLVLVCGIPTTCADVARYADAVCYLPLSVDVAEVASHIREKDRGTCYAGRLTKHAPRQFPKGTDYLSAMPRDELLDTMARYERVYAVGRTAIEARILGCEVLPYDPRFPDPAVWRVMDNAEAAEILQRQLDFIDGR